MPSFDSDPNAQTALGRQGGVDVTMSNALEAEASARAPMTGVPAGEPSTTDSDLELLEAKSREAASGKARSRRREGYYGRLTAVADMVAIAISMLFVIGILSLLDRSLHSQQLSATVIVMLPVWLVIAYIAGLYSEADLRIDRSLVGEIGTVTIAVTAWSWLLLVARTALSGGPTAMLGPVLLWGLVIFMMLLSRAAVKAFAGRRPDGKEAVALVGEPEGIEALRRRIERHPEWRLVVLREIENDSDTSMKELIESTQECGATRVMLVGGDEGLYDRTLLVQQLIERGFKVDIVSGGPEILYSNAALQDLEGVSVLSVRPTEMRPVDRRMKRTVDIVISSIGLVIAAPILAWAAIRIKLDSPGPVFFRQVRCGEDGQEFEVLKLRTMIDGADAMRSALREATAEERGDDILFKLEDDPRITKCGGTLRKWSIDELPQLWNVFKGEMSMVGPRPLPMDEATQVRGLYKARTRVKPGIAGPWQAYGRSSIPFEDMMKLDYSYVAGWSMAEDLRLLLRTAGAAMRRRGAH